MLRALHTAFAHAQFLAALRSLRNLQLRAAVDGRHFHFCAQRRLRNRHRHRNLDIVALAREDRMRSGAHDKKQVARRTAVDAGIALALQANALAVARAGLDAELDGLSARERSLAVAGRAGIRHAPRAITPRAGDVEFHAAAHLGYLAGALALRALNLRPDVALAVAGGAHVLAVDLDARLSAANRGPEVDCGLIFKIASGLWTVLLLRLLLA